jgi:hypothetical protein
MLDDLSNVMYSFAKDASILFPSDHAFMTRVTEKRTQKELCSVY